MESGKEGKDFFQPPLLDSPDAEKIFGTPESTGTASYLDQRLRSFIGYTRYY